MQKIGLEAPRYKSKNSSGNKKAEIEERKLEISRKKERYEFCKNTPCNEKNWKKITPTYMSLSTEHQEGQNDKKLTRTNEITRKKT